MTVKNVGFYTFYMSITQHSAECCKVPFVSRGPISSFETLNWSQTPKTGFLVTWLKFECCPKHLVPLLETNPLETIMLLVLTHLSYSNSGSKP